MAANQTAAWPISSQAWAGPAGSGPKQQEANARYEQQAQSAGMQQMLTGMQAGPAIAKAELAP